MNVSNRSYWLWRRVIGCIAAYVLALHGILVAFAGHPIGTRDANDDNTLRFELCIHDPVGEALAPSTPSAPASGDTHCKFCIAGAHSSIVVPTSPGIGFTIGTTGGSLGMAEDRNLPDASRFLSKQPRGPPLTA